MFFHAVVNVLPKGRGSPESGKLFQGGSLGRSEKFPPDGRETFPNNMYICRKRSI